MGGSGGMFGSVGSGHAPSELKDKLRQEAEASAQQFEAELGKLFGELLSGYNSRDADETAERLQTVKDALHEFTDPATSFDTHFGGSVAKHTYVDGISDVDAMLVVRGELADADPRAVLQHTVDALRKKLDPNVQVSAGRVAITVRFPDGPEIQLIPSRRDGDVLHVPAWEQNNWSPINPRQFMDGLTKRNRETGGKLIPTIKLVKAVNATLPENARLSGYHIESLGVAAFRGYDGECTSVRMLPYFFKKASELVMRPMVDRTGQSVHVDQNLGPEGSPARVAASHLLARIHQRMVNASAAKSSERWQGLFDD